MTEPDQPKQAQTIPQPVLDQLDELVTIRVEQLTATLKARLDELERRLTTLERGEAGPDDEDDLA
ncbi:MAG TPA: hypothetical protein VFA70_06080 [Dehalococcoidia bacterium]|nr:hypothetical protein [Dehalococcoidia bacterium]